MSQNNVQQMIEFLNENGGIRINGQDANHTEIEVAWYGENGQIVECYLANRTLQYHEMAFAVVQAVNDLGGIDKVTGFDFADGLPTEKVSERIAKLEEENTALKEKLEKQTLEEIECNAAIFLTAKALDEQTTKVECHMLGNVSTEPVLQGLLDLIGTVQHYIANFDMVPQEETQEKVRQAVLKYLEDATESRR